MMRQHAFVTGGTGFIGINLIRLLLKENWRVTALHRETSDLTYLSRFPVERRIGSVTEPESILELLPDDTDVIFHLAGDTNLWSRENERQTKVNVDGTKNMLNAAHDKRVGTFIYTSSASAWGEMTGRRISEELPQRGQSSWVNYERTKWAAEQEVLNYDTGDMKVVILNPTTVSGPYDVNNWGRLFLGLNSGDLPGIPDGTISVTHVDEVVKAHLSAVYRGKNGHRYLLAGEDCTFASLISEIAAVSGISKIPPKIPTPILKLLAYMQTGIAVFNGRHPKITPELVKLMTRKDLTYSSEKAMSDLGYRIVPMKRTVRDSYDWLSTEGYL